MLFDDLCGHANDKRIRSLHDMLVFVGIVKVREEVRHAVEPSLCMEKKVDIMAVHSVP